MGAPLFPVLATSRVRYIKLGAGGRLEQECLANGLIYFGFGMEQPRRLALGLAARWSDLRESLLADVRTPGTATNITNQARKFFEDDGSTVWITFHAGWLWWGLLEPSPPQARDGHDGVWRKVAGSWRNSDIHGAALTTDRLAGALTGLARFQGTSCVVKPAVGAYVVRRINGQLLPEVERALLSVEQMQASMLELIRLLDWRDFETLVDLVFSTSGWRRLRMVGGSEKTLDIDLVLPSTGQRAFVQVKSHTTQRELDRYIRSLDERGSDVRMFFVYHSSQVRGLHTTNPRVTVIGPTDLAPMVLNAGLASWLIDKVS